MLRTTTNLARFCMLFLGATLALESAPAEPAHGPAHGGVFLPAPPNTTPPPPPPPVTPPTLPPTPSSPGGGGPGSPGSPSNPGPSTPGPAGPGAGAGPPPSSPGPRGPSNPRGPRAGGNPGGGGGKGGPAPAPGSGGGPSYVLDFTNWQFWWRYNKDPYLQLRAKIHAIDPRTGSDEFFLGHGQSLAAAPRPGVDETLVRERIVPALLAALASERNNDVVTGTMIALAKIGEEEGSQAGHPLHDLFVLYLSDSVQEIRETAAVALGILADPSAIEVLEHLALDDKEGRQLVGGGSEVDFRTRSFAIYGLGLIGHRSGADHKQRIIGTLSRILEAPKMSTRDVKVAALLAMGLVPLPGIEEESADRKPRRSGRGRAADRILSSCEDQIDYVLALLHDERSHHQLLRAQAPRTLAVLLRSLGEDRGTTSESYQQRRESIAKSCLAFLGRRSRSQPRELRQSATLALGQIGNCSGDGVDVEIQKRLRRAFEDPDQQTKFYSLIALAQTAGRPGPWTGPNGPYDQEALRLVRKHLGHELTSGKRSRAWAGLALGVLGHALDAADLQPLSLDLSTGLRVSLSGVTNPSEVGAYSLALGLRGDGQAKEILIAKLNQISDDDTRGLIGVSLGLLGAVEVIPKLSEIVRDSRYRPALLREGSIALALLGDKSTVPELVTMLEKAKSLSSQSSIAQALGFIGDSRSVSSLVGMLGDEELTPGARAFAAVALGNVASKEWLPWTSKLAVDLNYRIGTSTLVGGGGTGLLDIQ